MGCGLGRNHSFSSSPAFQQVVVRFASQEKFSHFVAPGLRKRSDLSIHCEGENRGSMVYYHCVLSFSLTEGQCGRAWSFHPWDKGREVLLLKHHAWIDRIGLYFVDLHVLMRAVVIYLPPISAVSM
jgi:hypothetical protein